MIHGLQVRIRIKLNLAMTGSGSVSEPEIIISGPDTKSDPARAQKKSIFFERRTT
jgi:hypothetical protein